MKSRKVVDNLEYCKRCLYHTDHPLGIVLDDEGICSGCRIHEEKDVIDWQEKWSELGQLVKPYKRLDFNNYDCIVPVTGSQDSYYILHIVKEKLGLNPLLVTYNKYWNTPVGIENLANLRIKFNCDIIFQNVNPLSVKKIVKETLRRFGSIYWHCIAGQTVFPVQTAVRYKIPLIIWGAHQGMEQVGMFSHHHSVEMTRRYRKDHDLMGYEADDLVTYFNGLKEGDIWQYRYPDDHDIHSIGVRGIYLNNYVRWDPKEQHEEMIKLYGYKPSRFSRTFDTYDFVDCVNYMNIHDLLKFYKHGYSKVTDHASREIRHGRLTRSEAISLVSKYQNRSIIGVNRFCEWLGLNEKSLDFVMDNHRNRKFWNQQENNKWTLLKENLPTQTNPTSIGFKEGDAFGSEDYITIGKGVPAYE